MAKISVIVPIFNREKSLARCVESIMQQTYQDLEIILVNDGSTDNSLQLCNEFAQKDSRIVVLDKPNGGVSSARNAGLDIATGEFIGFVDSDDYIDKVMYEKLIAVAENENLDFVVCKFYIAHEENGKVYIEKHIQSGLEEFVCNRKIGNTLKEWSAPDSAASVIWSMIVKREVIAGVRFDTRLIHREDTLFFLNILLKAQRRNVLNDYLYYYVSGHEVGIKKYCLKPAYIPSKIMASSIYYELLAPNYLKEALAVVYQNYQEIVTSCCIKEKNYKQIIREIENKQLFSKLSRKKCYKAYKSIIGTKGVPLKTKCLQWLTYHRWFFIVRLYYKIKFNIVNE